MGLRRSPLFLHPQSVLTSRSTAVALSAVSVGTLAWYSHLYGVPFVQEVKAMTPAEEGLHPPQYPWTFRGPFDTFDHAA